MKDNMELKVGMYVRTKYGIAKYIHKVVTKETIYRIVDKKIVYDNIEDWEDSLLDNEILKTSYNIIDLIEVGDYVNGSYVYSVVEENKNTGQPRVLFTEEDGVLGNGDIKSIVTKEIFANAEYKVETK